MTKEKAGPGAGLGVKILAGLGVASVAIGLGLSVWAVRVAEGLSARTPGAMAEVALVASNAEAFRASAESLAAAVLAGGGQVVFEDTPPPEDESWRAFSGAIGLVDSYAAWKHPGVTAAALPSRTVPIAAVGGMRRQVVVMYTGAPGFVEAVALHRASVMARHGIVDGAAGAEEAYMALPAVERSAPAVMGVTCAIGADGRVSAMTAIPAMMTANAAEEPAFAALKSLCENTDELAQAQAVERPKNG